MEWAYLFALLASIAGLATLDRRYKLAYWYDRRRTAICLGIGVAVFTIWDMLGISLGIFRHGESEFALPFRLFPEFPLEELFFLLLLCYSALIIYRGASRS